MSRYFLTGATGFLGRHLAAQLREQGHDVVALCRRPTPELETLGVSVHRGDLLDREALAAALEPANGGCDGVFHCAGKVSRHLDDAEEMHRLHVDGTKLLLAVAREAGVPRVVVASTSGTVAVSDDPDEVRDERAASPIDIIARFPYYRSKLYAEQAALAESDERLQVVCVNPSLLLGPGDIHGSSTEDVRKFLERKIPVCPGGGIAFVDARDAASAMIAAMARGRGGERYLVNAANMTLEAFFGRLERLSGVKAPPVRLPRTSATLAGVGADLLGRAARLFDLPEPLDRVSAEMAQYYWYCDSTRAEEELGWSSRDPNETLADTVDDLFARGIVWPR